MHYPERICRSFAHAAATYDQVAFLQRQSLQRLLPLIPVAGFNESLCLDVGGGTGELGALLQTHCRTKHCPEPLLLDWAAPMLQVARQKGNTLLLQADMHHLPLQTASIGLLISNFAVQWCTDPGRIVQEMVRVMRPGGWLALAMPVAGSLQELSSAWQAAGLQDPVNRLPAAEEWLDAIEVPELKTEALQQGSLCVRRSQAKEALSMLSISGASAQTQPRKGLLGRSAYAGALKFWNELSESDGFLLQYQVLWLCLQKR